MRLTIITAFNAQYQEMGELCFKSILRHAKLYGHSAAAHLIPNDWPREASWAKIGFIRQHLKTSTCVLWIDADAMIVSNTDLATILQPQTLNIAKDHNGINCGVMAWWSNLESFMALKRIESNYTENPWFEQKALMAFVDQLDVYYQAKWLFNAYPVEREAPADIDVNTIITHWPGMTVEERLPLMREAWEKMK